ncbi:MAG: hypothetical protein WBJ85_08145, partial [Acetomicrobium sp.]
QDPPKWSLTKFYQKLDIMIGKIFKIIKIFLPEKITRISAGNAQSGHLTHHPGTRGDPHRDAW